MKKPTMRKLTPIQLDTLVAFYYGEVRADLGVTYRNGGTHRRTWIYSIESIPTSRVKSLLKRRLAKQRVDDEGQLLITITPKGIEELMKHPEII